jgi:hypothetical protein
MILQRGAGQQPRALRLHQWLFLVALLLTVSVVPHAMYAYVNKIPAAFVVIHAVAAGTCWIVGELRRQWQHRVDHVVDLASEITSAHQR